MLLNAFNIVFENLFFQNNIIQEMQNFGFLQYIVFFFRKTRKQQEREEKQREEELQAQLQKEAEALSSAESRPYDPPCDSTLLKFIDEVSEKIQPLPTTREQVKALAV